jgi:hypothetical protein
MARIRPAEQSAPSTPASGYQVMWPDSTSPQFFSKDVAGRVWGRSHNAAVAAQGAGFATDTYVTDSDILIPSFGLQTKTILRWTLDVTKTAAGVATPSYIIRIGSARTTADTARVTLTGPAQTAAADNAIIEILVSVRSVSAAGVVRGAVSMKHDLSITGFATTVAGHANASSAAFDNSALGGSYIGLSIDGGASAAWTITQSRAEASW